MKTAQEIIEELLKDRQKCFDKMYADLRLLDGEHNTMILNEYLDKVKIIDAQIKVLKSMRVE